MARNPDWTLDENRRIVAEYFDMLARELEGLTYNKAERNRRLQLAIHRSHGSIEFKHANISAVMQTLGLPPIDGYKPRSNTQVSLNEVVVEYVESHGDLQLLLMQRAASLPGGSRWKELATPDRLVESPAALLREKVAEGASATYAGINYVAREAQNKALGKCGEEYALLVERRRLDLAGRPDLSKRVKWSTAEYGDGLGYDIQSFDPQHERPILIEVKTTNAGIYTPFFVTRNELNVSTQHGPGYRLFRIFKFDSDPRFFVKDGAFATTCDLLPQVYRATVR